MNNLADLLRDFNPKSEEELGGSDGTFAKLAKAFLYGGYISVTYKNKEQYRIYIRTVEFYCHYEGSEKDLPKDPIVYHRNGRYVEGEVPYFPLMSFHAHASGYDITFENEKEKLRASALIRAYEVYDVINQKFLCYDTKAKIFRLAEGKDKRVNKQSTYLYNFLNGFGENTIVWKDNPRYMNIGLSEPVRRQNVYEYDWSDGKWMKSDRKDEKHKWSFTRLDEIEKIDD